MKPRTRFYHVLMGVHTLVLLVVSLVLWVDNRRATTRTRAAIAGFDRRLFALEKQVDSSLSGSGRVGSARATEVSQVDSSLSAPGRVGFSRESSWVRRPPRVLGSGRSGHWAYVDVLYADGASRRHYVRTNSTPRDVKLFVRSLSEESLQHSWILDGDDGG